MQLGRVVAVDVLGLMPTHGGRDEAPQQARILIGATRLALGVGVLGQEARGHAFLSLAGFWPLISLVWM